MKKILAVLAVSMLVLIWGASAQTVNADVTQADVQNAFDNVLSGQVINQATGLIANTGSTVDLTATQLADLEISGNTLAGSGNNINQTAIDSLSTSGVGHILSQSIVDEIQDNVAASSSLTQFDANLLAVSGTENFADQEIYKSDSFNTFDAVTATQTGITNATISGTGNNVFQAIGCANFPTVQEQICPDVAPDVVGEGDFGQQIFDNTAASTTFTQVGSLTTNVAGVTNDIDQNLMQFDYSNIAANSALSQSASENAIVNGVNVDLDQIKVQDINTNTMADSAIRQVNNIAFNVPGVGSTVGTGGAGAGDED